MSTGRALWRRLPPGEVVARATGESVLDADGEDMYAAGCRSGAFVWR